jgi:hypothetical protein
MEVTFTKIPGRRYVMTVARERAPELAPRQGPGYHDYLPHDAVHFLVEAEARLSGGVFGRIAAGHSNLFWPSDPVTRQRQARRERKRKPGPEERADMGRSEALASLGQALWEFRAGHRRELPSWFSRIEPGALESPLVEGIVIRLGEFAARWRPLPEHGSVTLAWPVPARSDRRQRDRPRPTA